jgi:hypothetical protein
MTGKAGFHDDAASNMRVKLCSPHTGIPNISGNGCPWQRGVSLSILEKIAAREAAQSAMLNKLFGMRLALAVRSQMPVSVPARP